MAETVKTSRRTLTVRETRERLWIRKLRRLPCFDQVVKKLVDGQSVTGVARWLVELNPDGELKDIGVHAWRKYLTALSMRIRRELPRVERQSVEPLAYRAVMEEFERQVEGEVLGKEDVPPAAKKIWAIITKAVRELDAEMMLKYCFVIQQGRVQQMLECEDKLHLLLPDGHKNLAVLLQIAAEVRKFEVGEQGMKGKVDASVPRGCPDPDGSIARTQSPDLGPSVEAFKNLDAVDRNLLREAGRRVSEMIRAEVSAMAADNRRGNA